MENCVDFGYGLELDCFNSTIEPLFTLIFVQMHKDSEQHKKTENITENIQSSVELYAIYLYNWCCVVDTVSCLDSMVLRFRTFEIFGHKNITDPKMVTALMVCQLLNK